MNKLHVLGALALALALFGCAGGDKTAPGDAGKTPETPVATAPTNDAVTSDAPKGDAPAAEPGAKPTAVLTGAQLKAFVTVLGKVSGHGGIPADQIDRIAKDMQDIPQGESKTDKVHIDFQGRHLDVPLTVAHGADGKYTLTFEAPDAAVGSMLDGLLKTAAK